MADWKTLVRTRLAPLRMKPQAEAELADELAQHLEDSFRELRSGGASEEDAYTRTIAQLDDVQPLRAGLDRSQRMEIHDAVPAGDANRGAPLEDLWRDLRYAARTMRHSPMFVLFVVLTLGLGANTTVFTLINTLIVNPLPVEKASELAAVAMVESSSTSQSRALLPLSYVDLKDYQARNKVFSSLAGYTSPRVVTWQANGASERMFTELVTANYFSTLGLRAATGRYFLPEEDSTAGAHPVAVMNYGTWQTRFGGRPDIIGSELRLNNVIVSVIGVAPPGFIGVNGIMGPDVWIPAAMMEHLLPNQMLHALSDRSRSMFFGAGRLKPGVTVPQAQANLMTIASGLAREYPATNEGHTAAVRSVRDVMFPSASGASPILFASAVLLIVVAIVLLIACSNVANLLLARAAARPPAAGASVVDRKPTARMSQRRRGDVHRLRRAAASGEDVAGLWYLRHAEARCDRPWFCVPHLAGHRLSVRRGSGVQRITCEHRHHSEGRGADGRTKPEQGDAGKRPARRTGCIVIPPAGHRRLVSAQHAARVRDRSRFPDGASRGLRREPWPGRVRPAANSCVLQRRA
jgi:putative ABC transport system permease protein